MDANEALRQAERLTRPDFEDPSGHGTETLEVLFHCLRGSAEPTQVIPAMFALLERLDGVDLGSPGPVVHLLESFGGHYEDDLELSLDRHPTPLTVWMVNRLMNRDLGDREAWLQRLESAARHPLASAETADDAMDFYAFQVEGE